MTIEHDDPEEPGEEARLAEWASDVAGEALLREGLSPRLAEAILQEALQDYVRFRASVGSPRRFVMKRIVSRAELCRRLRGIVPAPDREGGPRLLRVVHTRAALETLVPAARRALEMLFREGKSYEEIAGILGVSVAGVRRLVTGALKRLRAWRAETGGE
jgi:DNA-binding CsgD family transcriptional regulator